MALMPAPPTPTMWMAWGGVRSTSVGTGVLLGRGRRPGRRRRRRPERAGARRPCAASAGGVGHEGRRARPRAGRRRARRRAPGGPRRGRRGGRALAVWWSAVAIGQRAPGRSAARARPARPRWSPRPGTRRGRRRPGSSACRPRSARGGRGCRSARPVPRPGPCRRPSPARRRRGGRRRRVRPAQRSTRPVTAWLIRRAPSEPPKATTTSRSTGRPRRPRAGVAVAGPVDGQDLGAHRVAGDHGPGQVGAREGHGRGLGEAGDQPVGRAGHGVLLGHHDRDPVEHGGQGAGDRGVAAEGHDDRRPAAAHEGRGRARRPGPGRRRRRRWPG